MNLRRDHLFTREALLHVLIVGIAVTALAIALQTNHTTVPVLSPSTVNVVPAVGEQGFNVEAFCNDPLTTVARDLIAPPDSTYNATYQLTRVKAGIHEVVTVGVYADPNHQPNATHYDSANVPTDGFVSKGATDCIQRKGVK